MDNSKTRLLPLKQAAEYFGIDDLVELERSATHLGCRTLVGNVSFIDITRFEELATKKMVKKNLDPKDRKKPDPSIGRMRGTIKGRIARTPRHIESRKRKLEAAQVKLAQAATPYEESVVEVEIADHKKKISQFEQQLKLDQAELERLNNIRIDAAVKAEGQDNSTTDTID